MSLKPAIEIGLPFKPLATGKSYFQWPLLPQLFPVSFPGIQPCRDDVVVDIDRQALSERMQKYFDPEISDEELRRISPSAMTDTETFLAAQTRNYLQKRGMLPDKIVQFCYRPFDMRWLYWEPETNLLDRKREDYFPHVGPGNVWLVAAQRHRREFDPPCVVVRHCSRHIDERGANLFPLSLHDAAHLFDGNDTLKSNTSEEAVRYLAAFNANERVLFYHTVAILHAASYRAENAGALRQDWPRVPLPAEHAAIQASGALGEQVAALLDTESDAPGITVGKISPLLKTIGLVTKTGGGQLDAAGSDLAVTAGWGHKGKGGVTMPGKGTLQERNYSEDEGGPIGAEAAARGMSAADVRRLLGEKTYDVSLNGTAYWRNVPVNVWEYTIGGYQVIKKWLSYRELEMLGRALKPDEAREVMNMARRIAAIILMQPKLDENYRTVAAATYAWPSA